MRWNWNLRPPGSPIGTWWKQRSRSSRAPETTNRIFIGRTLVGRSVLRVADIAMEAVGGSAFYRATGLERLFRDIQGARYHRPQGRMQREYSGRLALGQDVGG